MSPIDDVRIEKVYQSLLHDTMESGYFLNPDVEFTKSLIRGILENEDRYGYWSCPCRLATGVRIEDLDIICPCDYRDPDLAEFGACYCALYVNEDIAKGERPAQSIPERRPPGGPTKQKKETVLKPLSEEELAKRKEKSLAYAKRIAAGAANAEDEPDYEEEYEQITIKGLAFPVWRCKVCGYLCARPQPPEKCPVCKVTKDRFERFI